jgi:hypothetical protein
MMRPLYTQARPRAIGLGEGSGLRRLRTVLSVADCFQDIALMGGAPNIQGALVESAPDLTTVTANGVAADGLAGFQVSN